MESGDADAGGQGRFKDLGVAGGSSSPLWRRIKSFRELWATMKAASRILFTIGRVALERTDGAAENNFR